MLAGCTTATTQIDDGLKQVSGNEGFYMDDNLSCEILTSSKRDEIGRKVSLINLNTSNPKVLFEDGFSSPLKISFETERMLVLQLLATSGSTDIFSIDKTSGVFARTGTGVLLDVYAIASKGNCN